MSSNISLVRCEVKTKFSFIGKTHVLQKKIIPFDTETGQNKSYCSKGKMGILYQLHIIYNIPLLKYYLKGNVWN